MTKENIFSKLEHNISSIPEEYSLLSIAISLKRIADKLETIPDELNNSIYSAIADAIRKT